MRHILPPRLKHVTRHETGCAIHQETCQGNGLVELSFCPALQAELARRLAADRTTSKMTEEMRREIAAARTVTALQAKQFESELAELRQARDAEAGSLTAQLEGARRTERELVEEISKTNLELALVQSEKEQAVARAKATESVRARTFVDTRAPST